MSHPIAKYDTSMSYPRGTRLYHPHFGHIILRRDVIDRIMIATDFEFISSVSVPSNVIVSVRSSVGV